jgi:hypothetical protein
MCYRFLIDAVGRKSERSLVLKFNDSMPCELQNGGHHSQVMYIIVDTELNCDVRAPACHHSSTYDIMNEDRGFVILTTREH